MGHLRQIICRRTVSSFEIGANGRFPVQVSFFIAIEFFPLVNKKKALTKPADIFQNDKRHPSDGDLRKKLGRSHKLFEETLCEFDKSNYEVDLWSELLRIKIKN